jgi:hypothetical protein
MSRIPAKYLSDAELDARLKEDRKVQEVIRKDRDEYWDCPNCSKAIIDGVRVTFELPCNTTKYDPTCWKCGYPRPGEKDPTQIEK